MNISGRKVGLAAVLVMALMLGIWSEADSKTPATRTRTEKAEPRLKVSRQIPQKLPQGWFKTATRNGEYEAIRLHRFLDEIVVEGYNVNVDDGHHCVECYWADEITFDKSGKAWIQTFSGFSKAGQYWKKPVPCSIKLESKRISIAREAESSKSYTSFVPQVGLFEYVERSQIPTGGDSSRISGTYEASAPDGTALQLTVRDRDVTFVKKKVGEPIEAYTGACTYNHDERTYNCAVVRIGYCGMPHELVFSTVNDPLPDGRVSIVSESFPGSVLDFHRVTSSVEP